MSNLSWLDWVITRQYSHLFTSVEYDNCYNNPMKKRTKKAIVRSIIFNVAASTFLFGSILISSTHAQTTSTGAISFQLSNPLGGTADLPTFVQNILKAAVLFLTPVVTVMMLYSGFLFVKARGNSENLTEAKSALMYTMIGAALVLGAEGFSLVIKNTVTCLGGSGTGC